MNEYDSNRIFQSVKKIGFEKTYDQENADCYILNTCHIRDKAKEKVYHEIGRVKKIYKNKINQYLQLQVVWHKQKIKKCLKENPILI